MSRAILVTQDTWFKQAPRQAADLPASAKHAVLAGDRFLIVKHEPLEDLMLEDGDQHVSFTLAAPTAGKKSWFAFQRHVAVMEGDRLLFPAPEVDERTGDRQINRSGAPTGKPLNLPSGATVYVSQPIIKGGNFSWGEATHGGERIPLSLDVERRIIKLALQLEEVRRQLGGKPVRITSWYRPEPFNSRAGGARRSQHLSGGAVDIVIEGMSGREMGSIVAPSWAGGLGIYPGNRKHILHLDIGTRRRWGGL